MGCSGSKIEKAVEKPIINSNKPKIIEEIIYPIERPKSVVTVDEVKEDEIIKTPIEEEKNLIILKPVEQEENSIASIHIVRDEIKPDIIKPDDIILKDVTDIIKSNNNLFSVYILRITEFIAIKDHYGFFKINENIKYSLIKTEDSIKEKREYNKIINKIEEYFIETKSNKLNGFNYEMILTEYEKLLIKLNLKDSNYNDIVVEEKNVVIIFFNFDNAFTFKKIEEAISYSNNNDIKLYIVYNEKVRSKKDAEGQYEFIKSIFGYEICVYFIDSKEKSSNYFDLRKCYIVDKNGYIRFIGYPKDFFIGINDSKNDFDILKNDIESYIKGYGNDGLRINLSYSKAEIYDLEINKIDELTEPIKIELNNIQKFESNNFLNKFPHKELTILNKVNKKLNLKQKNSIIVSHIEQTKIKYDNLECRFTISYTKQKNYYRCYKFNNLCETTCSITFYSNFENFTDMQSMVNELSYIKYIKNIPDIKEIRIFPDVDTQIQNELQLKNTSITLSDEKPKIIIYIPVVNDLVIKYSNRIWDAIQDYRNDIELVILYNDDSVNDISIVTSIFNNYYNPYEVCDLSSLIIFNTNIFTCLLLDCENILKYIGNTSKINIALTIQALVGGRNEIINIDDEYSHIKFKEDFKSFISNINLNYNPLIEYSEDKIFDFRNGIDVSYSQQYLRIIVKELSNYIEENNSVFFTSYSEIGILDFISLKCISLKLPTKCISHPNTNGQYYDQVDDCYVCQQCEEEMNKPYEFHQNNLIYVNYSDIELFNEVIDEFYNSNLYSGNTLEKIGTKCCSVCNSDIENNHSIVWLLLTYIQPILLCNKKCMPWLLYHPGIELNQEELINTKLLNLDRNNIIAKKIILPL